MRRIHVHQVVKGSLTYLNKMEVIDLNGPAPRNVRYITLNQNVVFSSFWVGPPANGSIKFTSDGTGVAFCKIERMGIVGGETSEKAKLGCACLGFR